MTVALPPALDYGWPSPRSLTAEGFLAAQSYKTSYRADCAGRAYIMSASNTASRVRVHATPAATARDAIDRGVDLLVTDDPAIVAYAARDDSRLALPLPWDRTYVALTSNSATADVRDAARLTLADRVAEAVRADSRRADGPFWWDAPDRCVKPTATIRPATLAPRVAYLVGDRVAQGLAERLVALAARPPVRGQDSALVALLPGLRHFDKPVIAAPLAPHEFLAALRAGGDLAYVMPLPRFAHDACHELATLMRAAPWVPAIIPLIDTRHVALVRRGRIGLYVDDDGILLLLDQAPPRDGKP